jgi:hypothetical protein
MTGRGAGDAGAPRTVVNRCGRGGGDNGSVEIYIIVMAPWGVICREERLTGRASELRGLF